MPEARPAGALDGQVAIITGGERGQGRADAVALASLGARVVLCDVPAPMASVQYEMGTTDDLIVAISSAGGRAGLPGISHYAAAKWGMTGPAKSLALLRMVSDNVGRKDRYGGPAGRLACPARHRQPSGVRNPRLAQPQLEGLVSAVPGHFISHLRGQHRRIADDRR